MVSYSKREKVDEGALKRIEMEALAITFAWGAIVAIGLIVWFNTKSGKQWLDNL